MSDNEQARFEVYPCSRTIDPDSEMAGREPTGEFGWRFRSANGQITAIGGEGFTRHRDAHRAVVEFLGTISEFFGEPPQTPPPIIDVDE